MAQAGPSRRPAAGRARDIDPEDMMIDPALLDGEEDNDYHDGDGASASSEPDELEGEDGSEYEDGEEGEEEDEDRRGAGQEEDVVFSRLAGLASRGDAQVREGREWEQEAERAEMDEYAARGRAGLGKQGKRLGKAPKRAPKPSHEVQRLLGAANSSYAMGDLQEAIDTLLEVIRHDPRQEAAWTTLASCYEEKGEVAAARQMRFCAMHLGDEAEGWKGLAQEFGSIGQTAQCLYCLRRALRHDPSDVEALFELASILRAEKENSKAVDAYKRILKYHAPSAHDVPFLLDLLPLFSSAKQSLFLSVNLRQAFNWHIQRFASPDDHPSFPTSSTQPEANTMQLEHIIAITDLLMDLDQLEEAVTVIRRGMRWLQGRRDQRQWDAFEDDREYDPPGATRVTGGVMGPEDAEGFPLDTNLRHRLALIRLKLGNDDEAMTHIEEVLNLDVMEHHALFQELGDALLDRQMWDKALECYAVIQECEQLPDVPSLIFSIAKCHHEQKSFSEALEALRWVVSVDPNNFEAKLRLANVLEDTGQKAEALDLVGEVIRARAMQEAADPTSRERHAVSKSERAASRKLSKRVMEDQMRTTMHALAEEVRAAEEGIEAGEFGALERFEVAAGKMVENYRLAKSNFGKSRGVSRILRESKRGKKTDLSSRAQEMQDRLERVMGFEDDTPLDQNNEKERYLIIRQTEFYGLGQDEWLALIVKYCCVLMVKNDEDVARDILEHVLFSGLFYNHKCEIILRLTIIACAMRTRDYFSITENCKRLAQMHQFRSEPFRLMLACLSGGGLRAQKEWLSLQLQKFLHRELRLYDDAVKGRKMTFNTGHGRWNVVGKIGLSRALGDDVEVDNENPREGDEEEAEDAEEEDEEEDERPRSRRARGRGRKSGGIAADGDKDDEDEDEEEGEGEDVEADEDEEEALEDDPHELPRESAPTFRAIDHPRPRKFSAAYNTLYGQHMISTRAYQSALFYLFRAYEQDQYDPFICLLIAQSFFMRSVTRQVDNRNYMIVQGMAFLTKYRALSPQDQDSQEEVEYNYGRSFHAIGVPHLAITHYERVLASVQARMDVSEEAEVVRQGSLAYEAAYNLMLLYAASGCNELAKERSKWLAV